MGKITAAITGVGEYLPDYILTNDELSHMVDTNDEWIMSHTGIKTRHILKGEGIGSSYMGARAVINLLDKTGVDPMSIDAVICATVTPDMFFPSTGNLIADQAGCKNAFAYDVSAACSGFLFALTTGAKFIEAGSCKRVIVVGADKMSSIVDYTDRSTCPLFGDAAAAVLLEPNTEGYGVIDSILRSDGSGELQLYMKAGGSRYPASLETIQNNWHTIMWDGHAVFKAAVSKMSDVSVEMTPGEPAHHRRHGAPHGHHTGEVHDQHRPQRQHHGRDDPDVSVRLREGAAQGRQPDSCGFRRRLHLGCDVCEMGLRRLEGVSGSQRVGCTGAETGVSALFDAAFQVPFGFGRYLCAESRPEPRARRPGPP